MASNAEGFDGPGRLRLAAGAALLFVLVAGLTVAVWHVDGPTSLDRTRLGLNLHLGRLVRPGVFGELARLGSPGVVAGAAIVLAVFAARRRDWFAAVLCVLGPAFALFLTEIVAKPLIDRRNGPSLSFPSGHVTGAAAVAAIAVLLAYRSRGRRVALAAAPVASLLPVLVAFGVVHLGWHYVSDAAGGIALGAGAVLAMAAGLSALWPVLIRRARS